MINKQHWRIHSANSDEFHKDFLLLNETIIFKGHKQNTEILTGEENIFYTLLYYIRKSEYHILTIQL